MQGSAGRFGSQGQLTIVPEPGPLVADVGAGASVEVVVARAALEAVRSTEAEEVVVVVAVAAAIRFGPSSPVSESPKLEPVRYSTPVSVSAPSPLAVPALRSAVTGAGEARKSALSVPVPPS